ncbi:chromosome segregation ATPase [Syntrophus gentianae]|uniref:Chromosome segregation ATPase n=1 Tax=Syntrophus gentianae TaxID=43775 RepID=A0A1H7VJX3_9BACT|nr:AAA family ATPase [Syntrophus gentianae]SEM09155.1 chromosome segregation ATPase [Syntrophus gentianae]
MRKVISIANQKGGVGKTTTAINLSATLATAEKKTLLIDCDAQGNASSGVGIDREKISEKNLYSALISKVPLRDVILPTCVPYLDAIAANQDLVGIEVEFISIQEREKQLKRLIRELDAQYDFIILDCPPSLGFLTLNALVASSSVIVPLQCEYFALEGLGQLMSTLKLVKTRLNPLLSLGGILLTMFDSRNLLSRRVSEDVRSHFGSSVFNTVIPRNVRLSESPSHGLPIIFYDIKSRGAVSYMELAQEVLNSKRI